jgi:hypothetical protein
MTDAGAGAPWDGKGPQLVVTSKADSGRGSLRDTLAKAQSGSTVTFHLPKHAQIKLTTGPITISKKIRITGPGTTVLFISANRKSQIFSVAAHVVASISDLTLRDGKAAQGGAIYNAGSLTVDDVAFNGNAASGAGSSTAVAEKATPLSRRPFRLGSHAIRHAHAPRMMVTDASGAGAGGAIYNAAHAKLTVTKSMFSENAAAYGGAIDNLGMAKLTSDVFKNNAGYRGSGSPVVGAFGYGAALYDSGKLTVASCTFTANVAGGHSQGSFGVGGAIAQISGVTTVVNSVFDSNIAGGGTGGSWGTGGAIYTTAGSLSVSGSTFNANEAGGDSYGYGGGIYADQTFSGSKNKFSQNFSDGTSGSGAAYGGAVYAGNGVSMSVSTFSSNSARAGYAFGGAIDGESSSTLPSDSFTGNSAVGGSGGYAEGGAVYLGSGSSVFTSATFSANRASAAGAGSFASGGGVAAFAAVNIGGASSFSANVASAAITGYGGEGGAMAIEQGPFSFIGAISNNTATTQGGGLWIDGLATLTNSTISGNSVTAMQAANDGGGGIYAAYAATLTMSGSTIASNKVYGTPAYAGGGGIFNAGGATMTNSTIENNTSSVDGGGLENDAAANVSLENMTIYANTASLNGGSLKNLYADASITIANSILAHGTASGGPNEISNDGSVVSGDYDIIQSPVVGNVISGTTSHDLAVDPQLAGLASNGGPTQTSADGKTSPGTAYIPFDSCLQFNIFVDQRGLPRDPVLDKDSCDVGAYENQDP